MLEFLSVPELYRLSAALGDYVSESSDYFEGARVEDVLNYLASTPNEFCLDDFDHVLRHLGYDHEQNRYQPAELVPLIIAVLAANTPDESQQDITYRWHVLVSLRFLSEDPSFLSEFTDVSEYLAHSWDEACGVFGWEFLSGRVLEFPEQD